MSYENISVETRGHVGLIMLNCPKALNVLNGALIGELGVALFAFDADANIGATITTGSEEAFVASADIGTMANYNFATIYKDEYITCNWEAICRIRKPAVAAVADYALGGGYELAMICDIVPAVGTAKFGQPEIELGTMPGADGMQRLPRAVSEAEAMGPCLTARMMGTEETERTGLASRVILADKLPNEMIQAAEIIADFSLPTIMMIKESISAAHKISLGEGVHLERRLFRSTSVTKDQKEGMRALTEKRVPTFKHQ